MEDIRIREFPLLVLSIMICQAAGYTGSYFTDTSIASWYPTLIKPWFTPPGWLIGIVWFVIFTLMGISLFFAWHKDIRLRKSPIRNAVIVFGAQLVVNILWSAAFFGLRSPLYGLITIAFLWVLILVTMVMSWRVSRDAALLLVPYLIWVSFAAFLNYTIWVLNL